MSNVVIISQARGFPAPPAKPAAKRISRNLTTDDYRRILSEMRLRPPSQRAFLRKFLKHAASSGVSVVFPVTNLAVAAP